MMRNETWTYYTDSILMSYAQVFFSKNRVLAGVVLLATFVEFDIGFWGLVGVLLTNGMAVFLNFDRAMLRDGVFGLNSLLVACGMAASYTFSPAFVLFFGVMMAFTLLTTAAMSQFLSRYGLPFLSLPFVLGFWVMMLAARQYTLLSPDPRDIYFLNTLYAVGGKNLVGLYEVLTQEVLHPALTGYFKSLAAILFAQNWWIGVAVAFGLVLASRLGFLLSILGYAIGYAFYGAMGADASALDYGHLGFNFILSAIAIGGYFFVPTFKSLGFVILLTPIIAIATGALSGLVLGLSLPVVSLPFALSVMMVLYTLSHTPHLHKVTLQQSVPEENLYAYRHALHRFGRHTLVPVDLPFFGEWAVTQGYDGGITHKDDWQHALDFEVQDADGAVFMNEGKALQDYYCYDRPVLAPASGEVVAVARHILDNAIGEVNLHQNWGNTVVLKLAEGLYAKMSHLKNNSITVQVGDYVYKGATLGYLGNSGRSPIPHLHFQLQATPYIGAKTLPYPLASYLRKTETGLVFHTYDIPKQGEVVSKVQQTPLLQHAFSFTPGQIIRFAVEEASLPQKIVTWEVGVNAYNEAYLYCAETKSWASFVNDGTLHYFTGFGGDHSSVLYHFYLAAYKVLLGYYPQVTIEDTVPLHHVVKPARRLLQDVLAPFKQYLYVHYTLNYKDLDDTLAPKTIELQSSIKLHNGKQTTAFTQYSFLLEEALGLSSLQISEGARIRTLRWLPTSPQP